MQLLNKNIQNGHLSLLRKEKGNICVSIIVPCVHMSSWRDTDKLLVKNAFFKAKSQLAAGYNPDEVKEYINILDELYDQIDYYYNDEGLGFFLTPNLKLQMRFSFPVSEKVFVGEKFLIRDALFQQSYSFPYYVLHLTAKKAQLFRGCITELAEISDENFPFSNIDDYEYSPPSRGSSNTGHSVLQNFERDASVFKEIRNEHFLQQVDKRLHQYYSNNYPLVICGELKDVARFKEITKYSKVASSFMVGNYQHLNSAKLAALIWPILRMDFDEAGLQMIDEFRERIGSGLTESGIVNIWQAVRDGRCFRLLVEKDFSIPGYLDSVNNVLYLKPPEIPHVELPDAVDEVIDRTLDQGGEVVFVGNGKLKDYQCMALFTRY